ncbi:MAG TPA: NAD(P)(+) transhydrogenase (Re/Si-specific) subunit beta [Kofleriaceae bacterium]|nr:NAD(P)(+) transhydrogenase (Re/Si-specific) subunit beta [Kofleriaceae bacterium]
MRSALILAAYLVAAILFVYGLKGMAHPRTALRANLISAVGMLIAVVAVLLERSVITYQGIAIGIGIGTVLGAVMATRVKMTQMPEFVAVFNGFGGAASALVAWSELHHNLGLLQGMETSHHAAYTISVGATALVGAVTLWGSLVAYGKLSEKITSNAVPLPGGKLFNAVLLLACLVLCGLMVADPQEKWMWILLGLASVLGVTLTIPIGGADMPVVISLMNSYSGIAGACAGFVLRNNALIISGALVGASGIILTAIMCKAMNRSLANVLFAGVGAAVKGPSDADVYGGKVKATTGDEVAMMLDGASRVVFVPGYGMAVSQCQHAVRELTRMLEKKGVTVEFGIHPVAGRMPGHMNVLLAEADIEYDKMIEMDDINPTMSEVDVCIILGANDVVNPLARTDPTGPLAGMPIIDADKARTVVIIKRSLSPGFAKVPNPLFAADNALMYFADGKQALVEIQTALKELE